MSDTQHQPVGFDMSRFWRLVSVEGGPVEGTFWVRRPDRHGVTVTAVDVTVWGDDERTWGRNVRSMAAFIVGDEVDIPEYVIGHRDLSRVLARLDDAKAAVLAAARAVEWGDDE
jgi:hypothetical protein